MKIAMSAAALVLAAALFAMALISARLDRKDRERANPSSSSSHTG